MLLFGDESEALTHPYLAHAWAKKGAHLRIPSPGQAAKMPRSDEAMLQGSSIAHHEGSVGLTPVVDSTFGSAALALCAKGTEMS